ncbi:uncharacterized protein LOC117640363 [Thrips palmi]|uniref:Uncharacterized protein LOC117640363 n=1 Tax=Thrips palmi TaxID=161013 RepID=A0A6P8XZW2_THRPL|nr:uncharacterized protein LOC117640363 [Thrips palmi]
MTSRSRNGCVVRGCTTTWANRPAGVSLVTFPTDERRPKWVEAVKGKGSDWVPSKSAKICTLHFPAKYLCNSVSGKKRRLLLPGAIPNAAPQLPPASTIIPKHLPNSNVYFYRKKKGSAEVESPAPIQANPSPQQLPETAPHDAWTSSSQQHTDPSPHDSWTPSPQQHAEASPNGSWTWTWHMAPHNVLPWCPPPSNTRNAVAPEPVEETPAKDNSQSNAPVPVCLDIEEDDSPHKVALKKVIAFLDKKLKVEKRKNEQEIRKLKEKLDKSTREVSQLKEERRKNTQEIKKLKEKLDQATKELKAMREKESSNSEISDISENSDAECAVEDQVPEDANVA